jgi:hypothetical protein
MNNNESKIVSETVDIADYETVQAAKYAYHRLIAAGRSEEA